MLPFERMLKRKAHLKGEKIGPFDRPFDYGRVADRNIRSERLRVMCDLPDTIDSCYGTGAVARAAEERHRRASRYQEHNPAIDSMTTGRVPPVSRDGASKNAATLIVAVFCFVLAVITLVDVSALMESGKNVALLKEQIAEMDESNLVLEKRLADSNSDVTVGYDAVQLGLLSAKGVEVIYLTAPESAQFTLHQTHTASVSQDQLATILGD